MKLVFICAPFRGANPWDVAKNVQVAENWAYSIARLGAAPVCPQTMWQHFDKTFADEFWLEACRELLKKCDALFIVPSWPQSIGCIDEIEFAQGLKIPTIKDLLSLEEWIKMGEII